MGDDKANAKYLIDKRTSLNDLHVNTLPDH